VRSTRFFVAFALVAAVLAGVVSYVASASPDGLNRVAADHGIADQERRHALADGPMAGYGLRGVDQPWLSGGLAGIAGVGVVLALTSGLVLAVRRKRAEPSGR
jgi:PDGLE domain